MFSPLVQGFRLFRIRRAHPGCIISTSQVSAFARLGTGVCLARGVSVGPGVVIGDHTYVNPYTEISSATIGKFCSIAGHCLIGPDSHPLAWLSTSPRLYALQGLGDLYSEPLPPPSIGNDVWIGSHVIVQRGVRIGDGAVVGSGAVVTRDVDPYAIVVGAPAKHQRFRFDPETIRQLLDLRWWDQWDSLEGFRQLLEAREGFVRQMAAWGAARIQVP